MDFYPFAHLYDPPIIRDANGDKKTWNGECEQATRRVRKHPLDNARIPHRTILIGDTRRRRARLTKPFIAGSFFKLTRYHPLTPRTKKEHCSSYVPRRRAC